MGCWGPNGFQAMEAPALNGRCTQQSKYERDVALMLPWPRSRGSDEGHHRNSRVLSAQGHHSKDLRVYTQLGSHSYPCALSFAPKHPLLNVPIASLLPSTSSHFNFPKTSLSLGNLNGLGVFLFLFREHQ